VTVNHAARNQAMPINGGRRLALVMVCRASCVPSVDSLAAVERAAPAHGAMFTAALRQAGTAALRLGSGPVLLLAGVTAGSLRWRC
jgi:hypothetical protein